MKAAYIERFGAEDTFVYGDVPDPKIGPRQTLIRIKATAINRGDLMRRKGTYGGGSPATFPFVDSWEVAGVIEAIGSEVKDRRVGQRIAVTLPYEGYAALVAVNRAGTIPLPDSSSKRLPGSGTHLRLNPPNQHKAPANLVRDRAFDVLPYTNEHLPAHHNLRHLEYELPGVSHKLPADFDELDYLPFQTGALFSTKARGPSTASSLA